jgi:hypothetical protein
MVALGRSASGSEICDIEMVVIMIVVNSGTEIEIASVNVTETGVPIVSVKRKAGIVPVRPEKPETMSEAPGELPVTKRMSLGSHHSPD